MKILFSNSSESTVAVLSQSQKMISRNKLLILNFTSQIGLLAIKAFLMYFSLLIMLYI